VLARIITTSLDGSDVIPQPPPSTALSRHVALQGVMVEVPGEMHQVVGSDPVAVLLGARGHRPPNLAQAPQIFSG